MHHSAENHLAVVSRPWPSLGGILVLPSEYGYAYPPLERYSEAMQAQVREFRETLTGQHILRMYREHRQILLKTVGALDE